MIGWLLDTNVVTSLTNPQGAPSVKRWAAQQDEQTLFLCVLTLAEFDKGIHNIEPSHPDRTRYSAQRDALEARFRGRILGLSNATIRRWGVISGETKRRNGRAPEVIDTLLAATAIESDLFLVTRNTKHVVDSGAALFDPWTDDAALFPLAKQ